MRQKKPSQRVHSKETRQDKTRQGTLAKALDPRRKPPEGRARDGIVLSIMPASKACLCVLDDGGKMARKVNKRHHIAAAAVFVDPTQSQGLLVSSVAQVLCAAPHSIPHPIPTHPYRFVTSPSFNCAGVCVCVWLRGGGCAFCFVAPCIIIEHGLPPPSPLWSCPLAHQAVGTRAATILWSSVRTVGVSN